MALAADPLAQELANALGENSVSDQLLGWAKALVTEMTSGIVTFGNIPGPHPILGLVGPRLATLIAKEGKYPGVTPQLIAYSTAITTYIMTSAVVTYTTPIPAPPAILPPASWFLGGTISGMAGPLLAAFISQALGQPAPSEKLLKKSDAIVKYIQTNAMVASGIIS